MSLTVLTDESGSLTWVGLADSTPELAKSSTLWQIMRIDDATSGVTVAFANGSPAFIHRWSERATLVYTVS